MYNEQEDKFVAEEQPFTEVKPKLFVCSSDSLDGDHICNLGYRPGLFNPIICPKCGTKVDPATSTRVTECGDEYDFEPVSNQEEDDYSAYRFTCPCGAVMAVFDS